MATKGADHDFKPWGKLTPFGIFLPDRRSLNLYFHLLEGDQRLHGGSVGPVVAGETSNATRRYDTLLLDLDNGPENHSRRSQFIYRLVLLAQATQLTIVLVYYPPYHSKYNPIERCWGVLEVYWNGELLDSEAAVLGFAANMTYAGKHPHVYRVSSRFTARAYAGARTK